MKINGISLISGHTDSEDNDGISEKLWSQKGSISIRASSKDPKPVKGQILQKGTLDIEMTSKVLQEEKEAIVNKKSLWPVNATVSCFGRVRHIEAEKSVIEDLTEWAESKGMNCQ